MTLAEMLARRQSLLSQLAEIRQAADARDEGEQTLTVEEAKQSTALLGEIETLDTGIDEARAEAAERDRVRASIDGRLARQAAPGDRRVPPAGDGSTRASVVRHAFEADPRRGFESMGEFAMAAKAGIAPGGAVVTDDPRLRFLSAASGLSAGDPSEVGVLMPPGFSKEIWDGMHQTPDSLISECDVYTVEGESLTLLANAETSRATGSRFGGIRGYWRQEADQMVGSKPKLREMKLEPHELYVFVYATDKIYRSNPTALTQLLTRGAQEELVFLTNDAIVEGTGIGQPRGWKGSPAMVTVPKEGSQANDTVVTPNIDKMFNRCLARNRQNASWFINQDVEPELFNLAFGDSSPVYMPPGGIADVPNGRLRGRPVRVLEYADTLGDVGDISLVDPKAYAVGTRGTVETAMSMHLRFDYGENAWRFRMEIDGQPWPIKPLTPFKGATTYSPFVNLAAR